MSSIQYSRVPFQYDPAYIAGILGTPKKYRVVPRDGFYNLFVDYVELKSRPSLDVEKVLQALDGPDAPKIQLSPGCFVRIYKCESLEEHARNKMKVILPPSEFLG